MESWEVGKLESWKVGTWGSWGGEGGWTITATITGDDWGVEGERRWTIAATITGDDWGVEGGKLKVEKLGKLES